MASSENPWLGLKSYSEGKRLYGRDKEIEELSQKILYNTQTVIYGKSGIGKSSLLKAGVFPILRRNNYFPVYVRFVHEERQGSYISQIITAVDIALKRLKIEDLGAPDGDVHKIVEGYKEEIVPVFREDGEECMWEYFHRHQFYYKLSDDDEPQSIVPVLIFDQFEEIFTLQKNDSLVKSFFEDFAGLLNNICPKYLLESAVEVEDVISQIPNSSLIKKGVIKTTKKWNYIADPNIHVVLSLREDFLSHLERNIEHIPSLKHNRYCLLPLNEDQAAEVITQPILGMVSVEVAKEIISKVTDVPSDEFEIDDNPELEVDSAILSLFLSELFVKKGNETIISYELVELFGSNIISDFYEKTVSDRTKISKPTICYLEKRLVTREGRRDSIFEEQALRNGVTRDELIFLSECRLLHQYPWRDGIRIEFSHDVLCPIIIDRRKCREELLGQQRQLEAFLKVKEDKKRLLIALSVIIVFLFASAAFIYDGWFDVKVDRYANITKEFTWMKGLKLLSKDEASHLNHYYVFYKTGRYTEHPDSIEARNGYGELTADHNMGTYLVNQFDDTDNKADRETVEKLKTVVKWVLISDKTGKYCLQERAFDEGRTLVYSFNNTIIEADSVFISTYVDEYGFPIVMRDSNYIYLRTTIDKEGHEVLQEFFDDKGFPVMNKDGAFQTERGYFSNGVQHYEASRFLNGHWMIDRVENCGWQILKVAKNGFDNVLSVYFNADRKPCRVNDGTMFKRSDYDDYGRIIKETYWKIDEAYEDVDLDLLKYALDKKIIELLPDTNAYGVHGYVQEYNRHGKNTLFYAVDLEDNPIKASNRDFLRIHRQYDDKGSMIQEVAIDENEKCIWEFLAEYSISGEQIFSKSYSLNENADTLMNYHLFWDKKNNRKIEKDYYDSYYNYREYDIENRVLVFSRYEIETDNPISDSDGLHKIVTDYLYDKDNRRLIQTQRYFNKDGYICGYQGRRSYSKEVTIIDSILHTKSTIQYTTSDVFSYGVDYAEEPNENFYRGYEKWFNEDFTISLGEASLDANGFKHRTYENGAYYYQVKYVNSILPSHANESLGHYAMNEFGEPSLIRYDGTLYSVMFNGEMYDENGHKVEDEELDRPLFAAIETDENMGFAAGDILIQQDDWILWESGDFSDLDLEPKSDTNHKFKVLRFNESNKEYDLVEIEVPIGDERISQIEYKKFYMTKAEEKRVYDIMRKKVYNHIFEFVPDENGAMYERGMRSPALVLSVNDWDMIRHFGGDGDSLVNVLKQYKDSVKQITVYDEDLEEVQTYIVDSDTLGVRIESYSVRPKYYNQLRQKLLKSRGIDTSSINQ